MESNNANNNSDLLVRLNRLENQVSMLSSQLEVSKITISQLNQSLADRDLQISELEKQLTIAQNSFHKTTINKIYQCREQVKQGIDLKIVNPVLTQIQKYIEAAESLVAEATDFIIRKKAELHGNFNATSNLVLQGQDQAIRYFEKAIVEPVNLIVKNALLSVDSHYKTSSDWLKRELIDPGKVLLNRMFFVARELPMDIRLLIQMRVLEPALTYVYSLPAIINNLCTLSAARLKTLINRFGILIQQCLDFIAEQIKKSSFWDGKHRIQATV